MPTILLIEAGDVDNSRTSAAFADAGFDVLRLDARRLATTALLRPDLVVLSGLDAGGRRQVFAWLEDRGLRDVPALALVADEDEQAAALVDGAEASLPQNGPARLLGEQARSLARWHRTAGTGRLRWEAEAAASRDAATERHRVALEIAELGTWECDREAGWIRGDARCAEIVGLPPDTQLPLEAVLAVIHPTDRERVCRDLAIAADPAGGGVYTTEYRVCRPDGSERCVTARARLLGPGSGAQPLAHFVGTLMDVTERHRVNEALRESEGRLRLALNAACGGAYVVDLDTDRLLISPEAAAVYGLPRGTSSLSRADFLNRIVSEDRPPVSAALDRAAVEGTYRAEYRIVGEDRTIRSLASFAQFQPDTRRLVGFVMDVSDRKRAEEALRDANARLAASDRRKDEFIAVLSHELRNPLAPIRYAVPLLEREALSETGSRAVAVVDRQVHHLTRLVDDLLDVSRITRGKVELRREHVTLHQVLAAAVEAASPAVAASRHALHVDLPNEPVWLRADAARLAQVVTNLLDNSAKYTPQGGQIVLSARRDGHEAVISVKDSGIGIPQEELRQVFEMFRQARSAGHPDSVVRTQPGLGIGLALSRMLIQMHGGTIQARSAGPGQGSEFLVRLPAVDEEAPGEREQPSEASGRHRRLRVLVVDDNRDLVEMLATLVSGLGHDVRRAFDGRSAIAAAASFCPNVVLLDLGLPGMSGLEVARALRAEPALAGVHLVALTGWGQADDRRRTRDAGFDVHLTKPTEPEALERLLAQFAA